MTTTGYNNFGDDNTTKKGGTNKYFNSVRKTGTQNLFDALVIQAIQIHGIDVIYIQRDINSIVPILQEPDYSTFNTTVEVEMYMDDGGIGQGGDNAFMSKFGMEFADVTELFVAVKRWEESSDLIRPREGDLIFVGDTNVMNNTFTNTIYQINKVYLGGKNNKFEFGKNYMYRLVCQIYTPSYDTFNTVYPRLNDALNTDITKENRTSINQESDDIATLLMIPKGNPFGEV